jgi:hypothetical protein
MDNELQRFLDFYKNQEKEAGEKIKLAEDIYKDLTKKLPKIRSHYHGYAPWSIDHMVRTYAHKRFNFTWSAKYYTGKAEKIELGFSPDAEKYLKQIQYKKLFDIQGLWRAGQKKIKEIDCSFDFRPWFVDIFNCPFLPPITRDEVHLMERFLLETPVELHMWEIDVGDYDWESYEYQKISYAEREEIELQEFYQNYALAIFEDRGYPPWYDFYDTYNGTGGILMLTDVKFPKELFYMRLYNKHEEKEKKEQAKKEGSVATPKPKAHHQLPTLGLDKKYSSEQATNDLVDEFESPEVKRLWKCYKKVENYDVKDAEVYSEEIDSIIEILKTIPEKVPIEEHDDWQQGLMISYRKYKYRKTIEAIPSVYEDYLMRLETGVGFAHPEEKRWPINLDDMKKEILEGRRLNGEPMDFNY